MPEPFCLAMVLCDAIHRDAATGKFTILGTFSTIQSKQYPADIRFTVYFAITDGLGVTPVRLRIVDSKSGLAEEEGATDIFCSPPEELNFTSPLVVVEAAALIEAQLPTPGLYHCELFAGDQLLMSRRLVAVPPNIPEANA